MNPNNLETFNDLLGIVKILMPDLKMEAESCEVHRQKNKSCVGCVGSTACETACALLESYSLWVSCIEVISGKKLPTKELMNSLANLCITTAKQIVETSSSFKSAPIDMKKIFESFN